MRTGNLIKTTLFLAGLFLLLYAGSYLLLPYNSMENGFYKKANGILNEPKDTIDYIAIGDSECSVSISPLEIYQAYGYAGYNCGVPGQRLQDTYYLLERLLQNQSPKVVLLETNAFYRDFKYINALETTADEAAKKIFPIYKYHNSWKYFHFYMLKNLGRKAKQGPVTVYKGYEYSAIVKPYKSGPYVNKTDDICQIGEQPLFYLNKIAELCGEKHIQLILYSAPSPKCWTYSKHNAAASFAKEHQLTYIDLNLNIDALNIDWAKDSRDEGDHLNYFGARKVSDYIGTCLTEHTDLKDRRKEEQYASWNRELKNYLTLTGRN
ncbi:hypothetical protein [Clostridium sp. Marseille-P2415]|uniref:hypothetical protein n=1 Tax=Clostridium sp. Marseille-P2415 TaxID=1805471 RepID=UPI00098867C0|nr:hypothetical protein [Clostridium sp. Marseille-P2415]